MNSEKRLLLAVGVSFLILVLYPFYLKWISPLTVPGPETAESRAPEKSVTADSEPTLQPGEIIPAEPEHKENLYQFSHEHFNVEFSDRGGTITKLELKNWGKGQNGGVLLVDRAQNAKGAFSATLPNQGIDFETRTFSLEALDERKGEVRFASEEPGRWRLVKRYEFARDRPVISLEIDTENLSSAEQIASLEMTSQLDIGVPQRNDTFVAESFVALRDKLVSAKLNGIEKKPQVVEEAVLWQALTRKYFVLVVRPDQPAVLVKTNAGASGTRLMRSALQFSPEAVSPGGAVKRNFLIYAGPQYYRDLKSFGYGFEQLLSHGFFGMFKLWLLIALEWSHNLLGNYGWAIVLITFAIKLLFTPLTHMSFESMKKMQTLQPKLKALQERYKGDQAKLSKEMMELYKRNKVNPMSGCLPMVLQIPVFIAFYQVLAQTVELKGEPFIFWIRDLSEPDRVWTLPFEIPFLGDAVNVLPLLMLGSMVWQQHLTPQTGTPEQQKMMMIMPIVFGFIFYSLPSGLVLYWFVNNVLSIFHQLFIKGKALPHHEE